MRQQTSPPVRSVFPSAWWSFDLGKYRPCAGTYQRYDLESVPAIDEALLRGDFAWLGPVRAARSAGKPGKPGKPGKLDRLVMAAVNLGAELPAAFVRFMADPALRGAVPSCTACEWDPSSVPVPCRVVPGAFTVRFLRDQQDCLFWYLHLLPTGEVHVLCSPIPFDDPDLDVSREVTLANTWYCAPHFEHFVYRFWIENELWEVLESNEPDLTPAQAAYVTHYAAQKAAKSAAKKSAKSAANNKAPATKKATTKPSATKKSATKKSTETSATQAPAAGKATAKKPATKKPATKKSAAKKSVEKPATRKPATERR